MTDGGRPLAPVLVVVVLVALAVEGFMVSASRLWAATDSGGYIALAAALADRLDFGHGLFQFRLPGYPVLLAVVFRLCGNASPAALLILQHALVVATAVLGALLAWTLQRNWVFALLAGLFGAFSLHLSGYASTVLTEVPYAFVLTLGVLLLVRYHRTGGWRQLAWASAAAGLCAVTKAIGQVMPVLCLAVALHRLWVERRAAIPESARRRARSTASLLLAATLPATGLILPVMLNNYRTGGRFQLTCNGGLVLYHRAVVAEELDSATSASLAQVRATVAEARRRGLVPDWVTLRDTMMVKDALRLVHGMSTAAAAKVMGQAGRDLIVENPGLILRRGVRYAYRTLFMPDLYYRVVPSEMPPEMFDMDEATEEMVAGVGPAVMAKYVPLHQRPTRTSPLLGRVTRAYRRHVEQGPPLTGLVDSPYEEFVLLCVLGGLLSLSSANRASWMVPGLVVCWHVVVSAYLGGTSPRYAVPVHPLLHVFGACALLRFGQCLVRLGDVARWRRVAQRAGRFTAARLRELRGLS